MKKRRILIVGEITEQILFMSQCYDIVLMPFPLGSPVRRLMKLFFVLTRTIITQRPALLLVYPLYPLGFPSVLIAKPLGLTHISFAYGNDVTMQRSRLGRLIARLTIKLTDGIICDYPGLAKIVSSKGGRNVASIPMGAILPPRGSHIPPRDPNRIISVINFDLAYWKGVDLLIRAMKELPQANLLLVGDGALKESMVALASRLGLQDRVTFAGRVKKEELWSYLQTSSIFALATRRSFHEGTNRATIEAMYHGLPAVVTRIGGLSDLVEDGINGFVVPPEDPSALIIALARLLNDRELRESMGNANEKRAVQYSVEKMSSARHRYLSLFLKE